METVGVSDADGWSGCAVEIGLLKVFKVYLGFGVDDSFKSSLDFERDVGCEGKLK